MKAKFNVAVVCATGAVGVEFLRCLEKRRFPLRELRLLASARSRGKKLKFKGRSIAVQELKADSFGGVDIAFFSAGAEVARKFAPAAREAGAIVIDNSSAFRMERDVPLVIPEINNKRIACKIGFKTCCAGTFIRCITYASDTSCIAAGWITH